MRLSCIVLLWPVLKKFLWAVCLQMIDWTFWKKSLTIHAVFISVHFILKMAWITAQNVISRKLQLIRSETSLFEAHSLEVFVIILVCEIDRQERFLRLRSPQSGSDLPTRIFLFSLSLPFPFYERSSCNLWRMTHCYSPLWHLRAELYRHRSWATVSSDEVKSHNFTFTRWGRKLRALPVRRWISLFGTQSLELNENVDLQNPRSENLHQNAFFKQSYEFRRKLRISLIFNNKTYSFDYSCFIW